MKSYFDKTGLAQQMALAAAGLCLLVSVAFASLATVSSRHLLLQQQQEFGSALAHEIARRISTAVETGDLLSVSASLQHFVATSAAEEVEIFDVEGQALGQAGHAVGRDIQRYSAPVRVAEDVAGQVVITLNSDALKSALLRYALSLFGLAILLSVAVYSGGRYAGQRLARHLADLSGKVTLDRAQPGPKTGNELAQLRANILALPLDLLRAGTDTAPRDENYRTTAILYLHLSSLMSYVDTLDDKTLRNYTDRIHRVVYAAAGFYGGQLQVSRQFGLAVYFSCDTSAGSAPFRAASCGWLVQAVCRELSTSLPLSMDISAAIARCELGAGDAADIYPGLYSQHTLDELHRLCLSKPPRLLLSEDICQDPDVSGRTRVRPTKASGYAFLDDFSGSYRDLLDRQLRLILRRLQASGRRQTKQGPAAINR